MSRTLDHAGKDGGKAFHVRPVRVGDLSEAVRNAAKGTGHIHALHNGEGLRPALVKGGSPAFVPVRRNSLVPVTAR